MRLRRDMALVVLLFSGCRFDTAPKGQDIEPDQAYPEWSPAETPNWSDAAHSRDARAELGASAVDRPDAGGARPEHAPGADAASSRAPVDVDRQGPPGMGMGMDMVAKVESGEATGAPSAGPRLDASTALATDATVPSTPADASSPSPDAPAPMIPNADTRATNEAGREAPPSERPAPQPEQAGSSETDAQSPPVPPAGGAHAWGDEGGRSADDGAGGRGQSSRSGQNQNRGRGDRGGSGRRRSP